MHVSQKNEQGIAKITVILLLILAIAAYAGVQLFPLYWDHGNLEKAVQTTMMSVLVPPYKDVVSKVKQAIMTLLDNMKAQYEKEQVKVELSSNNKTIQVEVWYARAHHLPLYPNPKRFHLKVEHTSLLPISPKTLELPTRPPVQESE